MSGYLSEQPVRTVQVVRERGRVWADLPFRKEHGKKIPARSTGPQMRELDPFVRVEGLDWENGKLVISGCAYVPSIDIRKRRHTSKIVILRPRQLGRLPVIVVPRSRSGTRKPSSGRGSTATTTTGPGSGPRSTRAGSDVGGRWLTGDWDGFVLVRGRGVWRTSRLHTPISGIGRAAEPRGRSRRASGSARGGLGRRLHVQVVRTPAVLRGCEQAGDELVLDVDLEQPAGSPEARLVLVWSKGAATRRAADDGRDSARTAASGCAASCRPSCCARASRWTSPAAR